MAQKQFLLHLTVLFGFSVLCSTHQNERLSPFINYRKKECYLFEGNNYNQLRFALDEKFISYKEKAKISKELWSSLIDDNHKHRSHVCLQGYTLYSLHNIAQDEGSRSKHKRSVPENFRKARGQTQSQYLSFGGENSAGKAEAEATYGSSKAIVSGSNGIGSAQSQSSPYGCDECYGKDSQTQTGYFGRDPGKGREEYGINGGKQVNGVQNLQRPVETTFRQPAFVHRPDGTQDSETKNRPSDVHFPSYKVQNQLPHYMPSEAQVDRRIPAPMQPPPNLMTPSQPMQFPPGSHRTASRPVEYFPQQPSGTDQRFTQQPTIPFQEIPQAYEKPQTTQHDNHVTSDSYRPETALHPIQPVPPSVKGKLDRETYVNPSYIQHTIPSTHLSTDQRPSTITTSNGWNGQQGQFAGQFAGTYHNGQQGKFSGTFSGKYAPDAYTYPYSGYNQNVGIISHSGKHPSQIVGQETQNEYHSTTGQRGQTDEGSISIGQIPTNQGYPTKQVPFQTGQSSYPTSHAAVPSIQTSISPQQIGASTTQGFIPGQLGIATVQTGFPPSQTSFPPSQTSFPPSQTAFPPSQTGFPSSQTGFPPSQTGFPTSQAGFPLSQTGFPSSQTVFPTNQGGFSGSQTGFQPSQTGFPQSQTGVSPDQTNFMSQVGVHPSQPGVLTTGQMGYPTSQVGFPSETTGQRGFTPIQTGITTGQTGFPSSQTSFTTDQRGFSPIQTGQRGFPPTTESEVPPGDYRMPPRHEQGTIYDGQQPNYVGGYPTQGIPSGVFDMRGTTDIGGTGGPIGSGAINGVGSMSSTAGEAGGLGGLVGVGRTSQAGMPRLENTAEGGAATVEGMNPATGVGGISATGVDVSVYSYGYPSQGVHSGFDQTRGPSVSTFPEGGEQIPTNLSLSPNQDDKDADSQAQAEVQHTNATTEAKAQAQGYYAGGTSQSEVSGSYSGSGSFSAAAGSIDGKRGAHTQVAGGKEGATSNAEGKGGSGLSQAQVQLLSETGDTMTNAQSSGLYHGTNTQVQAGSKGGMADAQANGPGSTSSQAQIGFTPHNEEDEADDENTPFKGSGMASAQSGTYAGQTQSQLQGKFRYGIKYAGAAQAGSGNKDTVAASRNQSRPDGLSGIFPTFKPIIFTSGSDNSQQKNHKQEESQAGQALGQREEKTTHQRSSHNVVVQHQLETTTSTSTIPPSTTSPYPLHKDEDYAEEDYGEYEEEEIQNNQHSGTLISQNSRTQRQNIFLDPLEDLDATVTQAKGDPDLPVGTVLEPGQDVPGSNGYKIPPGFRGRVTSVANDSDAIAFGHNSQAQSVALKPGTGKIIYHKKPVYAVGINSQLKNGGRFGFGSGYTYQPFSYQLRSGESHPNFVSVTKSESGSKDIKTGKKNPSIFYTQSSTCGFFTNTCIMKGNRKICIPKPKINPDGSPVIC